MENSECAMERDGKTVALVLPLLLGSPKVDDWVKCAHFILDAGGVDGDSARQVAARLRSDAARDSAGAMYALGLLHERGALGPCEMEKAQSCFLRAVELGSGDAEYELARLCNPTGFESFPGFRDASKAEKLFLAAAEHHNAFAYDSLKRMREELEIKRRMAYRWHVADKGGNRSKDVAELAHEAFAGLLYRQWVYDRVSGMDQVHESTIRNQFAEVYNHTPVRPSIGFPGSCLFAITAEASIPWGGREVFLVSDEGVFFTECCKESTFFGSSTAYHAAMGIPFENIDTVSCRTTDGYSGIDINGHDLWWLAELLLEEDVETFCTGLVHLASRIGGKTFLKVSQG